MKTDGDALLLQARVPHLIAHLVYSEHHLPTRRRGDIEGNQFLSLSLSLSLSLFDDDADLYV
jgi:hypothetical protein